MNLVKTFWCYYNPNFGDSLNRDLFRRLGGIEIEYASVETATVTGIGSVLDKVLADDSCPTACVKRNPLKIFSSGFGYAEGEYGAHCPGLQVPERLRRVVFCYAVRGHKTAARLRAHFPGLDVGVIGDGGLLVKLLATDPVEPRFEVGIVPHYADKADPVFKRLAHEVKGAVVLDPREGVESFLRHLRECRTVVSTAMHPLIACDALGIPNQWIRISEQTTSRFKFEDYYSIYGFVPEPMDPRTEPAEAFSAEAIRARYRVSADVVAATQEKLKVAFDRLCADLRTRREPSPLAPALVKLATALVPGRARRHALRRKWLYEFC